jgi:hypothetical protein
MAVSQDFAGVLAIAGTGGSGGNLKFQKCRLKLTPRQGRLRNHRSRLNLE